MKKTYTILTLCVLCLSSAAFSFAQVDLSDPLMDWAKRKLGPNGQSGNYWALFQLDHRLARTVKPSRLLAIPDPEEGSVVTSLREGVSITLTGRRLPNGDDYAYKNGNRFGERTIRISSAAWYEATWDSWRGWIPGEDIALQDGRFNTDFAEGFTWGPFNETMPTDAIVAESTSCFADSDLSSAISDLTPGQRIRINRRLYGRQNYYSQGKLVRGDDVYEAICNNRSGFVSGRNLVLLGGYVDHRFKNGQVVIVNPAGVSYYEPSGSHVRSYQIWLYGEKIANHAVARRLNCDPDCAEFDESPDGKWIWACGTFFNGNTLDASCTPKPELGNPSWLNERVVLLRTMDAASIIKVELPECRQSTAVDLSNVKPEGEGCEDCTCMRTPWPAVTVDRTAREIHYETNKASGSISIEQVLRQE